MRYSTGASKPYKTRKSVYKGKKDPFNNEHTTQMKIDINQVVAMHTRRLPVPVSQIRAMFLEGEKCNTSNMLKKIGVPEQNLSISNNNHKTYLRIKELLPMADVEHESVSARIERDSKKKDLVWLDYTSTFFGNFSENIHPYEDHEMIFQNKLLASNAVVAHTCSTRGEYRSPNLPEYFSFVIRFRQMAEKYGYIATLETAIPYGKGMMFVLHTLKRRRTWPFQSKMRSLREVADEMKDIDRVVRLASNNLLCIAKSDH